MSESEQATDPQPKRGGVLRVLAIGYFSVCAILLLVLFYNTRLSPRARQTRELQQNWARWESQHITHYRMSLDLPYASASHDRLPLKVEVRDGVAVSVVDAQGHVVSPESDDDFRNYYPAAFTIPGLFSVAQGLIDKKPPSITVSYDPALGYPAYIWIDPWTEPCCQSMDYDVSDLEALP
jgi:hypothetical protein